MTLAAAVKLVLLPGLWSAGLVRLACLGAVQFWVTESGMPLQACLQVVCISPRSEGGICRYCRVLLTVYISRLGNSCPCLRLHMHSVSQLASQLQQYQFRNSTVQANSLTVATHCTHKQRRSITHLSHDSWQAC